MKWMMAAATALWMGLGLAGGLAGTAQAQSGPVVVELYTSQGCSSCPPADALMHKLAARSDVIALSLHVDYWDYIGWKDAFANPSHAERQRAYARKANRRSVYTPQMIIGGVDSVVGTHPMDVTDLIARHNAKTGPVAVTAARVAGGIEIAAKASRPASYEIVVARFEPRRTIKIKRGENAGKTLTYANVVSDLQVIGKWDGTKAMSLKASVGSGPVAVLIQRAGYGPIDAAALVK